VIRAVLPAHKVLKAHKVQLVRKVHKEFKGQLVQQVQLELKALKAKPETPEHKENAVLPVQPVHKAILDLPEPQAQRAQQAQLVLKVILAKLVLKVPKAIPEILGRKDQKVIQVILDQPGLKVGLQHLQLKAIY